MTTFSSEEKMRYARHLSLPDIGLQGQKKLKAARVLCVGAGGLGSSALLHLAAAGVGTLGMVDGDAVELSNLQRQLIYITTDIGQLKVNAAKKHLVAINPHVHVQLHPVFLDQQNAIEIFSQYDYILDGSDNFLTRDIINAACLKLKKPNISASIHQFEGQCTIFTADETTPCYRCLYETLPSPEKIPDCNTSGVICTLPGLLGTIQAHETIKLIASIGEPLIKKLFLIDSHRWETRLWNITRNPQCPACRPCDIQADARPFSQPIVTQIQATELMSLVEKNAVHILDVREPFEFEKKNMGGQLIPLNELSGRLKEIPRDKPIIVICQHGVRSQYACVMLQQAGFHKVRSLKDGLESILVDDATFGR